MRHDFGLAPVERIDKSGSERMTDHDGSPPSGQSGGRLEGLHLIEHIPETGVEENKTETLQARREVRRKWDGQIDDIPEPEMDLRILFPRPGEHSRAQIASDYLIDVQAFFEEVTDQDAYTRADIEYCRILLETGRSDYLPGPLLDGLGDGLAKEIDPLVEVTLLHLQMRFTLWLHRYN